MLKLLSRLTSVEVSQPTDISCSFCLQEKVAKIQEVKDQAMQSLTEAIDQEKKEQWRVEGRHMLFDAKRVRKSGEDECVCLCKACFCH